MADYTPRVGDPVRLTVTLDGTVKSYDPTKPLVVITSTNGTDWTHPLGYGDGQASLASIALRIPPVPAWSAGDVVADTQTVGRVAMRRDDGSWAWTDDTIATDADVAAAWTAGNVRAVTVKGLA